MAPTILVVESDQKMSAALQSVLQEAGFSVVIADNPQGAANTLARSIPDLVLSEVFLNTTDGFSLLKQLRQSREGKLTAFVFLSSRGTREDVIDGLRQGADLYLTKPISSAELVEAVGSRIRRFAEIRASLG